MGGVLLLTKVVRVNKNLKFKFFTSVGPQIYLRGFTCLRFDTTNIFISSLLVEYWKYRSNRVKMTLDTLCQDHYSSNLLFVDKRTEETESFYDSFLVKMLKLLLTQRKPKEGNEHWGLFLWSNRNWEGLRTPTKCWWPKIN